MSAPIRSDQLQKLSRYPAIPAPNAVRRALRVLPEHPCSYFADRVATSRTFYAAGKLPGGLYHDCMDAGFRRSGRVVYQPVCRGCRDCVPIRVPVQEFKPTKSQRRCRKRNQDLSISVAPPVADDESFILYQAYLREWHRSDSEHDRESFEAFLYDTPVNTIEFRYRDSCGKLLAIGLCDICNRSLSSVYFFFDPAERARGLGTFGALVEIDHARQKSIPHYYLGYWIAGCDSMRYKSSFVPNERLDGDGVWRRR